MGRQLGMHKSVAHTGRDWTVSKDVTQWEVDPRAQRSRRPGRATKLLERRASAARGEKKLPTAGVTFTPRSALSLLRVLAVLRLLQDMVDLLGHVPGQVIERGDH